MGRSFIEFVAARFSQRSNQRRTKSKEASPHFSFEPLEPRVALAADGLVPTGAQPTGALSGKIVYTSAGHGWQWNDNLNRWATDRGDNNEIVEDFGNQDQMTFYADYLLRAGATVVPMRPVGHQLNEVVLDNDSPGVTFSGSWSNSSSSRYYDEDYGASVDAIPYRYASTTTGAQSAVATYTPNITEAGYYPIYTWVLAGTDRTSQLYKINHTGGQTEIRVDHSKVGGGWVYLGTYYFNSGSSAAEGSVQISNQGAAGKVVIADAIRFGNGMGDVKDGPSGVGAASGTISGYPREDENSLMWLWRSVGQGASASSVVGTSNVSAPARMAEWMNVNSNAFGTSVYISFHSNAGGGRGAVGLISNNPDTTSYRPTPNQASLALYTGRQINQDMQALNGAFDHNWSTTTTHTYTGEFGEINNDDFFNGSNVVEMDATIIEVAYHDNLLDAQLMRDPKVRDQIGRSTYEATLEYFVNFGGVTTNVTLPSKPINVSAVSNASGEATLNWAAGPTGVYGNAATGYRIYASVDGYGFDGGTYVAGGGTTSTTLSGYDPAIPYYFKVVAVNAGGESLASEVIAVLPSGGQKQILIVNGFDRNERSQNIRYPYAYVTDKLVDRVGAFYNNSYDYVVLVASAIHSTSDGVHFASTSNEAVISGAINLADYDAVIWILGEESTANSTFNATEQTKVEAFIAGGGHLFVSGSEIAWDLDQQNKGRAFFENTLKGDYVGDDANTYNVTATGGGIFAGLSFSFDNGTQFYDTEYPDVIAPQAGALSALTYNGVINGSAGIQVTGTGGRGNIVVFGFPFETITTAANRAAVIDRVLDFFGVAAVVPPTPIGDFNGDGIVDGADFLAWQRGFGSASPTLANGDADQNGVVDSSDLETWKTQFGTSATPSLSGVAAIPAASAMVAALEASNDMGGAIPVSSQSFTGERQRAVAPTTATRLVRSTAEFNSLAGREVLPSASSTEATRRRPRRADAPASLPPARSGVDDASSTADPIARRSLLSTVHRDEEKAEPDASVRAVAFDEFGEF